MKNENFTLCAVISSWSRIEAAGGSSSAARCAPNILWLMTILILRSILRHGNGRKWTFTIRRCSHCSVRAIAAPILHQTAAISAWRRGRWMHGRGESICVCAAVHSDERWRVRWWWRLTESEILCYLVSWVSIFNEFRYYYSQFLSRVWRVKCGGWKRKIKPLNLFLILHITTSDSCSSISRRSTRAYVTYKWYSSSWDSSFFTKSRNNT